MATFGENWVSNPAESHSTLLSTGAWSMFGVATVFLFTRFYIRRTQAKLWLDDLILGISWVSVRTAFHIALNLHGTAVPPHSSNSQPTQRQPGSWEACAG